jgi:outer membrane protein assembly factor BamB
MFGLLVLAGVSCAPAESDCANNQCDCYQAPDWGFQKDEEEPPVDTEQPKDTLDTVDPKDTVDTVVEPLKIVFKQTAEIISGLVQVECVVTGGAGIMGVEFYMDTLRLDTDFIPPYNVTINTTDFEDGAHKLSAFTADELKNTASTYRNITIDNTPPKFDSTFPAEGSTLFFEDGPLNLELKTSDVNPLKAVEFRVNGLLVASFQEPPYSTSVTYDKIFVTAASLPKNLFLQFKAEDYLGQITERSYDISVYKRLSWTFPTLGEIWAQAWALPDGKIVFVNTNEVLYAVTQDGQKAWEYRDETETGLGSVIEDFVVDSTDGTTYVAGLQGAVHAVDKNGARKWKVSIGAVTGGNLRLYGNTVIVPAYNGQIMALNKTNGSVAWKVPLQANVHSSPAVSNDGIVYVGAADSTLYKIENGAISCSFPTGGEIWSGPVVGPDGSVYFGSNDGWVYAMTSACVQKWVKEVKGQIWGNLLITSDNHVVVASTSKYLSKLALLDGKLAWETKTDGMSYSSPVIDGNGIIYVGTTSGKVYAVNNESGKIEWSFKTADSINGTPLLVGKRLFIGCMDRNFYSLWTQKP